MKCVICKTGETKSGRVTVTLQRGETTVLIKDTPPRLLRPKTKRCETTLN